MYKLIIYNRNSKQKQLKLAYASNFIQRLKGLMFKNITYSLLYIQQKPQYYLATIHTFFMKKTIDVIYINTNNEICETTTIKPWKIHIPQKNQIKYIIELPKNTIKNNNITTNTTIKVVKNNEK